MLTSFSSSSRHFYPSLWFPSITYCRQQFLRKMWSIQLAFILLWLVGYSSPHCLFATLLRLSHDPSNWSSPSGFTTTFQNFPGISDLLSELSKFQHHTSGLLVSSLPKSPICWWKDSSCWKFRQSGIQFYVWVLLYLLSCSPESWNIPHSVAVFDLSHSVLEAVILRFTSL